MRDNETDGNIDSMEANDDTEFEDYNQDEYDEVEDLEQEEGKEEDGQQKNPLGIDIPENWQVFLYRLIATALTMGVWLLFMLNAPVETGWVPVILIGIVLTVLALKVFSVIGVKHLLSEFKELIAEAKEKKNNATSVDDE